ncbi:MAG: 2-C-methyl-D-erythritol 4-phosphate cytidylyltransferase [Verrucomicrobiota bacterium]
MTSAIIVAAGKGTRMGAKIDKLFLELAGRPVVAHTWQRFNDSSCIDEIILVVRDGMQNAFAELAAQFHFGKTFRFAIGGIQRQDSVWNGLEALSANSKIVAIQDGARPVTSESLIQASISAARDFGAAVAAQRVTDTIKESKTGEMISRHLERKELWSVQTPQTFRVEVIRRALAAVREKNLHVTDDTAACELIGQSVKLVESSSPNPKVTVMEDLPYLEMLLKKS